MRQAVVFIFAVLMSTVVQAADYVAERGPGGEHPNLNGIWQVLNSANYDLELIIPSNDVNALADAIMNLYNNKKMRKSLGDNAKRHIESKFVIDKMIEQMEQFYQEMYQKNYNGKLDLTVESTLSTKSDALTI